MSLLVFADWYNPRVLAQVAFFDTNTQRRFDARVGKSLPALSARAPPGHPCCRRGGGRHGRACIVKVGAAVNAPAPWPENNPDNNNNNNNNNQ